MHVKSLIPIFLSIENNKSPQRIFTSLKKNTHLHMIKNNDGKYKQGRVLKINTTFENIFSLYLGSKARSPQMVHFRS